MKINFTQKTKQIPFLKGVIFGDSGSGKSYLARDFAIKSCEIMNINRFILLDTENGWSWLKKEIPEDIEIIEPDVKYFTNEEGKTDLVDICDLFLQIKHEVEKTPVSCIVIDSCSRIGQLINHSTLQEVNQKKKESAKRYGKLHYDSHELAFQDWKIFNDKSDDVVNILKTLKCHVILCGRATSENMMESTKDIKPATERSVKYFGSITYEFDFSCLLKPSIDITNKDSFKTFETYVIKSRFADDGKILQNTKFLENWFKFFKKMDFEKIKSDILNSTNNEEFEKARVIATSFRVQMNLEQQKEIVSIVNCKIEELKPTTNLIGTKTIINSYNNPLILNESNKHIKDKFVSGDFEIREHLTKDDKLQHRIYYDEVLFTPILENKDAVKHPYYIMMQENEDSKAEKICFDKLEKDVITKAFNEYLLI